VAPKLLVSGFVKKTREMIAAGLGGAAGTVFDVVTLFLLVRLSPVSIPMSAFLAAGVGAVACFVFNKYVAFKDKTPVTFEQVARFGFVALVTGIITAGTMKVVAVDLHVPVLLAKGICAAAVFFAWTFPAQRRFVFKKPAAALG
jgi:putative flippase GtrA